MFTGNSQHFIFRNSSVGRKSTLLLLAILTISLIFMGIRLQWGIGISSGKIKPRPKAVTQNQIKTCKQILKSFSADPVLPESILASRTDQSTVRPHFHAIHVDSSSPLLTKLSRAPPQPSC